MQAVGVALIAAVLSVAAWRLRSSPTSGGVATTVRSVAVMNFRAAPDDQNAASLAQELPEELGTALSKTGLQIASHQSVLDLGGSAKPRDVGAQLGVDAVLDGSVRTQGSKFKVHVEVSNSRTGSMVWSETFTVEA
jgi:TolB-like protein